MNDSISATGPVSYLIADMPDEQKPREKALAHGIKSLSDAELMALIFATGIKGKNVIQMCQDILLDQEGHISRVARMDVRDFMKRYKGIGPAKALTMLAALELGLRASADALKIDKVKITDSQRAYQYMKQYLDNLCHEEFWILLLKQNAMPIKAIRIGQGGLTATAVDIRILLREAISNNAPMMMLFHNHPSGNIRPSQQDIALTKKIVEGAKLLDIRVLDHIVIGEEQYYSFSDEGTMPQ